MLPGYNTDVQHQGATFHIQTEDNGEANPCIVTLVYQGGAILARKKSDYAGLIGTPKFREEVRRLMREQHREMIRTILEGKLEPQPGEAVPAEAAPQARDAAGSAPVEPASRKATPVRKEAAAASLDEAIIDFLSDTDD